MGKLLTAPRLGPRLPPLPPTRDPANQTDDSGALQTGDMIDGRYQIEGNVGEGGVGVVYRALQMKLHRRVAVKLLQPESDEELRPRFEREAVTLAALSHPNIVSVQDYGITRGKPFLVMELLQGRTLRELIDAEGALAVPRALLLTREVLRALAYAHDLGIVHRDLKPANLLVQALPHHEHVKVLDFGFVKLLPGSYLDSGVQLSRVGFTFGTPAYMSPEHATGGNIDGRSDLYSLGILLFEMLTGKKPFEGDLSELIREHLSAPRPRLADMKPELAGRDDLQALVERAMAKDRKDRFQDAGAFLSAVDAILYAPNREGSAAGSIGDSLHGEPVAVGAELRKLGRAVQHFFTASTHIIKRETGPKLQRARAGFNHRTKRLREQSRLAVLALRVQLLALWARTKPELLRANDAVARVVKQLAMRIKGKPQLTSPADKKTLNSADAQRAMAGVAVDLPRAQTIVLDDPTHLDLAEVRPPSLEVSDSPQTTRQA